MSQTPYLHQPATFGGAGRARATAILAVLTFAASSGASAAIFRTGAEVRELSEKVEAQQKEIQGQQKELEAQRATIEEQQRRLDEQAARQDALAAQLSELAGRLASGQQPAPAPGSPAPTQTPEGAASVAAAPAPAETPEQRRERNAKPELPAEVVTAGELPGSIRVPGTLATFKLGGLVRFSAIQTFQPLGSDDRFLTHTIPVGVENAGDAARFSTNTRPSRLNFDIRSRINDVPVRAFIEGDFAATTGNVLRLRHAYFQAGDVLFGQTWSTFSDPESEPEDLDFEGLNSLNILRQPQIRWSPQFRGSRLALALEDSPASITGAEPVNRGPNLIAGRRWRKDWGHFYVAASLRDLRGQLENQPETLDSTLGWGIQVSGRRNVPRFNPDDKVFFQFTDGHGVAAYITDLAAAGGQDAVFDLATGEIHALPARGLSLAYEHHWKDYWKFTALRSTAIFGYVDVTNLKFQIDDAYHRTYRLSYNLVSSPFPGMDIGVQYIWGERVNKDGDDGTSSQFQLMAQYRF